MATDRRISYMNSQKKAWIFCSRKDASSSYSRAIPQAHRRFAEFKRNIFPNIIRRGESWGLYGLWQKRPRVRPKRSDWGSLAPEARCHLLRMSASLKFKILK